MQKNVSFQTKLTFLQRSQVLLAIPLVAACWQQKQDFQGILWHFCFFERHELETKGATYQNMKRKEQLIRTWNETSNLSKHETKRATYPNMKRKEQLIRTWNERSNLYEHETKQAIYQNMKRKEQLIRTWNERSNLAEH